jgi:hypothetical protein
MHGIFLAMGQGIRKNAEIPRFESIHIYPFLAESLGLEPAAGINGRKDWPHRSLTNVPAGTSGPLAFLNVDVVDVVRGNLQLSFFRDWIQASVFVGKRILGSAVHGPAPRISLSVFCPTRIAVLSQFDSIRPQSLDGSDAGCAHGRYAAGQESKKQYGNRCTCDARQVQHPGPVQESGCGGRRW